MTINEMINWYHCFFYQILFFSLSYPRSRLILTYMGKSLENRKHEGVMKVKTEMTMEIFSKGLISVIGTLVIYSRITNESPLQPR